MIRTNIALNSFSVSISHEESSFFGTSAENILLLKSNDNEPNMLTKVEVEGNNFHRVIYIHWQMRFDGEDVGILLAEQNLTLFIGAGTLSVSISLLDMKIVNQHEIMLFWAFKKVQKWILELGEIDCFLYDQTGLLLASIPVDPPYEYFETDKGIKFETEVHGTQWLLYPEMLK